MTSRHAVIGDPIAQSLSPLIHRAFAQQTGVDLDYKAYRVEYAQFEAFLNSPQGQGLRGVNITAPLKQRAAEWATTLSPHAEVAQSVNTLTLKEDGHWHGDSTDGPGLITDLRDNLGVTLTDARLLIVGAGGATWGILASLLETGVGEILVVNRNRSPLIELTAHFGDSRLRTAGLDALDSLPPSDLFINSTSIGHYADFDLPEPILSPAALCYDLSYGLAHRRFAHWLSKHPAFQEDWQIVDGLGMLVEQAACAFEIWHGHTPRTHGVIDQLHRLADRD